MREFEEFGGSADNGKYQVICNQYLFHAGEDRYSSTALSLCGVSWPVRDGRSDVHASAPGTAIRLVGPGDVRRGFLLLRIRAGDGVDPAARSHLLAPCGIHRRSVYPDA